jgi:hypothetical protein
MVAAAKTKRPSRAKSQAAKPDQPEKEIQLLGVPNGVTVPAQEQLDRMMAQAQADEPMPGEVAESPDERRFEAEQFIPIEKFGPPKGMYPEDAELFSFTPKFGDTIWFPMDFPQPTAVQVWEQYDLPWNVQTWQWMKWAKVPKVMQRKAVELLDRDQDEYLTLFNQWMRATGRAPQDGNLLGK